MRNALTDTMGERLDQLFRLFWDTHYKVYPIDLIRGRDYTPVGVGIERFIALMVKEQDAFDTRERGFHKIVDGNIYTFYYAAGRWYCKH